MSNPKKWHELSPVERSALLQPKCRASDPDRAVALRCLADSDPEVAALWSRVEEASEAFVDALRDRYETAHGTRQAQANSVFKDAFTRFYPKDGVLILPPNIEISYEDTDIICKKALDETFECELEKWKSHASSLRIGVETTAKKAIDAACLNAVPKVFPPEMLQTPAPVSDAGEWGDVKVGDPVEYKKLGATGREIADPKDFWKGVVTDIDDENDEVTIDNGCWARRHNVRRRPSR